MVAYMSERDDFKAMFLAYKDYEKLAKYKQLDFKLVKPDAEKVA